MIHGTLQSDIMLDVVAVHLVPNQLHRTLEFSWFNTPWVDMAPTPVHKWRYEDAGPGTIVMAPRWKVLVSKLMVGTFSQGYFPILVHFKSFGWGGTSWQRSLHIRLPLWESINQTYIELITYLGKRRLFTACEVRGLGISMSVLIILVDYFVRAVPVIVQWHLTLQRLCRNWRLAENTWLRGQWWGDRRGLEVIEINDFYRCLLNHVIQDTPAPVIMD